MAGSRMWRRSNGAQHGASHKPHKRYDPERPPYGRLNYTVSLRAAD